MRRWRPDDTETIFEHPLFNLTRQSLVAGPHRREALVLESPAWVNMIPLLPDERVVLVRQWRFGVARPTLEIPGGLVEGEPPREAAERELLEETGYRAGSWHELGELDPNPAIFDNRVTTYLATDLQWVEEPRGDGDEEIEVETAPLAEIPSLIARGEIAHTLVVAAFYLLDLHRR